MGGTIYIDCDAEGRGRCSSGSGDGFHSSNGAYSRGYSGNSSVGGYPSGGRTSGGEYSGTMSSSAPSGYTSNSGHTYGSYTAKYMADVSDALVKIHGSKPSLVLGFNNSIQPYAQKDTDGVSRQIKGLINDLNYQLTVTGFQDPKGIVLAHCDITDTDIGVLAHSLLPFHWNLTLVDFSNNRLGNSAVENLFYTMGTHQTPAKYIQIINLSNNFIGDYGAEYIAESLKSGRYPATKEINVSGNQITDNGSWSIAEALKTGKFPTLKRFDASGNDISLVGEKFMLDAIKHPSTQSVMVILKRTK